MLPREDVVAAVPASWIDRGSRSGPSLRARLVARVRWFSLNERLIAGEDPAGSAMLAAHAARLTTSRRREQIAEALRGLIRVAEQPVRVSRVNPDSAALLANERAVYSAAQRLETGSPVYARGVARLERLLTDMRSPVFQGGFVALADELADAAAELDGARAVRMTRPLDRAAHGRRSPRRLSPRRIARRSRARSGPGPTLDPSAPTGASFVLPNGSWFHGRRDSA